MGSFHWSFLANVEVATRMIVAQGGDNWYAFSLFCTVFRFPVLILWVGSECASTDG